ncbi:hypothetical protein GOV10_05520 [Candidatus Woesearchaeota archaeon]|nr:hypothetical protein [Candidatus Woesearchaeota archaeon]
MTKISYEAKRKSGNLNDFLIMDEPEEDDKEVEKGFVKKEERNPLTGAKVRRQKNKLNAKKKLTKREMDELFLDE